MASDNYLDRYIQTRDIAQFRCPTCDGYIPNNDNPGAYPGALSRRDNKTEVCSECGMTEALEDFMAYQLQQEAKQIRVTARGAAQELTRMSAKAPRKTPR